MTRPPALTARVLAASAGRDRVLDFVKVAALALVVIGHQVAWTTFDDGTATNTLDVAPSLWWVSWILQWLPVFFFAAGVGLRRSADAGTTWAAVVRSRATALLAAAIPLIMLSVVLTAVVALWKPSLASPAGVITVQLLWFIGVYLVVVLMSPVIVRLRSPWWLMLVIAGVIGADVLRIHVDERWGWINLVLVWSAFALIGAQRVRWARMPRALLAALAVASLAGASAALVWGPYSKALISASAVPGLSNLAPPTIVLCLIGMTQVLLVLLVWPALERLLARDRVWVAVAVAGSRSMGVYIWHMLVTSVVIALLVLATIAPAPLSLGWWTLHAASLVIVVSVSWLIAAPAQRLSRVLATAAARAGWGAPAWVVGVLTAVVAASVLGISESGLYPFTEFRLVAGVLPYVPLIAVVVVLVGFTVIAGRARASRVPGSGP